MIYTPLSIWCSVLTIIVVGVAVVTDLRSRRIPNLLTFTAFSIALITRTMLQGWVGFGLALSGAILAMGLMLLLHAGKGIGMGDLKLAGAIGALGGPIIAVIAMLASAIAGGILAVVWMMKPGGALAPVVSPFFIGLPFYKNQSDDGSARTKSSLEHMPYGLAIAAGSIITFAVLWWTGNEKFLLTFVSGL